MSSVESQANISNDRMLQRLAEKEKDLELAAKIGQTLLEQNRDLQNRNDFLEDALNISNDAIVQLRHELQIRMNLLRVYSDDADDDSPISKEKLSMVESLQRRMKKLELENAELMLEASNLKNLNAKAQEKENLRMLECSRNLDIANDKITYLQAQIAERNQECLMQSSEIDHLLKDISVRRVRENALLAENDDLTELLKDALSQHQKLSQDIIELQERYTEVLSMLHDAEEELGSFRQKQFSYRTNSADSLYDSLASELEASDSGFYSTLNSARSDNLPSMPQKSDIFQLSLVFEGVSSENSGKKFKSGGKSGKQYRSVAVITDSTYSNESDALENRQQVLNNHKSMLIQPSQVAGSCLNCGWNEKKNISSSYAPHRYVKVRQNSSNFDLKLSDHCLHCNRSPAKSCTTKVLSSESLYGYEHPKLGEPGKPGTRDLDHAMRRLNVRREVEMNYAEFRKEHGLLPIWTPFFQMEAHSSCMDSPWREQIVSYAWLEAALTLRERMSHNQVAASTSASNPGLLAAACSDPSGGVVTRSSIDLCSSVTASNPSDSDCSLKDAKASECQAELSSPKNHGIHSATQIQLLASVNRGIITRTNLC